MRLVAIPLILLGVVLAAAEAAARHARWPDSTARRRLRSGTMSDAEKRHRGYYPYHNGPFA